jgi:hypothetical protein
MPLNLTIGIVTYLGRFESYFKPLVRSLHHLFPDYDKVAFLNGHHETARQIRYLKEATAFLNGYPSFRYLTSLAHQPLARAWNRLIMLACHEKVLLLNDDVFLAPEFRHNLENLKSWPEIFTLNGSFSHFLIHKNVIRQIGWFDERFQGIGYEDADYICRLAMHCLAPGDVTIKGLRNYVAPPTDAGWADFSGVIFGKYAQINLDFFLRKWWHSSHSVVPKEGAFAVRYHDDEWVAALNDAIEPMPEYYPLACLDNSGSLPRDFKSSLLSKVAGWLSLIDYLYKASKQSMRWVRGVLPKTVAKQEK